MGKDDEECQRLSLLFQMAREGLTEKVTFEERLEGGMEEPRSPLEKDGNCKCYSMLGMLEELQGGPDG